MIEPISYLDKNDLSEIEDPAQSWNAVTIGAYTTKVDIADPKLAGWQPIAPSGDLSPSSRTSVNWERPWPIKPDVVFEGGNRASDNLPNESSEIDDLSLLTTFHDYDRRLWTTTGDTSAATALAAKFAAEIWRAYPDYRPETVRAFMVHSANWTDSMLAHAPNNTKAEKTVLLRRYGYGVPDRVKALKSANNALTLVVEDALQPFKREQSTTKNNEMKLHALPWPIDLLREFVGANARLRVTLSYFIEPNPGLRGWLRRHEYSSHGLRFDVKKSTETEQQFRERINKAARDEEEARRPSNEDARWELGMVRNRGSVHSDYWNGTAAELADRGALAVYPVGGWWKDNTGLERWNSIARYSLLISLDLSPSEIDVYSPIALAIDNSVEVDG